MVARLNLTIPQGARFLKEIVWKTGTPLQPVDLTGYTAKAQIRQTYSSDLLADITSYITLGTTDGTITIDIPAEITLTYQWGMSAVWDLHMISSGEPDRLAEGRVILSPGVTRE